MSQLDLENLLRYEHNLAACYEAEYLLELSLQRELISNSVSTDWPGYTDDGETRTVSPKSPPPSPFADRSTCLNEATEGMDVLTDSPHTTLPSNHTSLTIYGSSIHPSPSPASLFQSSVSPHTASVSPHQIKETPQLSNGSSNPVQEQCSQGLKLETPPSLPQFHFHFQNGVSCLSSVRPCPNSCHGDGPQRKRRCLQRPEM